jgi:hypothetical protein
LYDFLVAASSLTLCFILGRGHSSRYLFVRGSCVFLRDSPTYIFVCLIDLTSAHGHYCHFLSYNPFPLSLNTATEQAKHGQP